jgi:preprotein translocase SecE subunit
MWDWLWTHFDWVIFGMALVIAGTVALLRRERLMRFVEDVRQEWERVSTPDWNESVTHTMVVLLAVAVFAAFFLVVDQSLGRLMTTVLWR